MKGINVKNIGLELPFKDLTIQDRNKGHSKIVEHQIHDEQTQEQQELDEAQIQRQQVVEEPQAAQLIYHHLKTRVYA